ncbi:rhomboid membrane protein [Stenotrophomonas phage vB_SmaS_DLP_3]|nr:rhomboid membrane protein [Stenotrophomonas phage vB_SmaS_DLP_3]
MKAICVGLLLLSVLEILWPSGMSWAILWPDRRFEPWQPLTYWFVHVGLLHVLMNVGLVWAMARDLEWRYSLLEIGTSFVVACVVGGCLHALVSNTPIAGASAGVCALLVVYMMSFPYKRLGWFTLGKLVIPLFAVQTILGLMMPGQLPHLVGMLVGLCWMLFCGKGVRSERPRLV